VGVPPEGGFFKKTPGFLPKRAIGPFPLLTPPFKVFNPASKGPRPKGAHKLKASTAFSEDKVDR